MILIMKVSWIKYEKDNKSFSLPEKLGFDVFKLQNLEQTDDKIEELIENRYNTIILSNEVASFSESIIKKYSKNENINIIIYNTNMPELWLSLKFWHIFLFLTDTESYEVDTQCIFRENILMIICEKCTKII